MLIAENPRIALVPNFRRAEQCQRRHGLPIRLRVVRNLHPPLLKGEGVPKMRVESVKLKPMLEQIPKAHGVATIDEEVLDRFQ